MKFSCKCGATKPKEFRKSEPRRCKKCRRAYDAKRKHELRHPIRERDV